MDDDAPALPPQLPLLSIPDHLLLPPEIHAKILGQMACRFVLPRFPSVVPGSHCSACSWDGMDSDRIWLRQVGRLGRLHLRVRKHELIAHLFAVSKAWKADIERAAKGWLWDARLTFDGGLLVRQLFALAQVWD